MKSEASIHNRTCADSNPHLKFGVQRLEKRKRELLGEFGVAKRQVAHPALNAIAAMWRCHGYQAEIGSLLNSVSCEEEQTFFIFNYIIPSIHFHFSSTGSGLDVLWRWRNTKKACRRPLATHEARSKRDGKKTSSERTLKRCIPQRDRE